MTPVPNHRFQWRALTSVLIAGTFLFLALSGALLFVSPPGRIANWTDWRLLGLTKHEWTALHVCFSALFILTTVLHLIFNLRPMLNYFRNRLNRRFGWRREWTAALALCALVFTAALRDWVPFNQLLAWQEDLKQNWDDPATRAPMPHAELLSLRELSEQTGVELELATRRLTQAGASDFTPETRIESIARTLGVSAQKVYELIAPAPARGGRGHSGQAGGGLGWKTLETYCAEQSLDVSEALSALQQAGWQVQPDQSLREIAVNNGLDRPYAIIEVLRTVPSNP